MNEPLTLSDLPRGLPKRHATFLVQLSLAPSLDRWDYQTLTNVSHTTAQRDLAALLSAGYIQKSGHARATRYSLAMHSFSPIEQSFSPIEQSFPPIEQSFSPIEQSFSPIEQSFSPIEQSSSPTAVGEVR